MKKEKVISIFNFEMPTERRENTDFFWVCHWLDYFTSFISVLQSLLRRDARCSQTDGTNTPYPTNWTAVKRMFSTRGIQTAMSICNIFLNLYEGGNLIFTHVCIFVIFYDDGAGWKWNLRSRGKASQGEKFVSCFHAVRQVDISSFLFSFFLSRNFFLCLFHCSSTSFGVNLTSHYVWYCVILNDSDNMISNGVANN